MSEITIEDEGTLTEEELKVDSSEAAENSEEVEVESETEDESKEEDKEEDKEEVEVETEAEPSDDLEKWKKFARQHENEKKKLKSENDELSKKLEESNSELESLKHSLLVKDVVSELGLNEKQASFISGKSKEELLKSGSDLLEAFGSQKPTQAFKQGVSENVSVKVAPKTREEAFRALQD